MVDRRNVGCAWRLFCGKRVEIRSEPQRKSPQRSDYRLVKHAKPGVKVSVHGYLLLIHEAASVY